MKITDYAPRAAAMDLHIKPNSIGIEIGVDVGAHAEAILTYCNVKKLYLVDVWEQEYCRGYCEGRLRSKGFGNKIEMLQMSSNTAVKEFADDCFDFIYIDQQHDYDSVFYDLNHWWPKLKTEGILSLRNYAESNEELKSAADDFIREKNLVSHTRYERYHNEIIIFK